MRWQKLAGRNLLNKGHRVFQEDLNQAIEQYELSLMFNSKDPEAYYWGGVAYSRLGRLDLAAADLEKAIELNPHHFDSYSALNDTLFQKQEPDRIIEHWNRFIIGTGSPQSLSGKIRRLLSQKRFCEFLEGFKEIV